MVVEDGECVSWSVGLGSGFSALGICITAVFLLEEVYLGLSRACIICRVHVVGNGRPRCMSEDVAGCVVGH